MNNIENIPSVVSIAQMCKLLNLSKARFYSLISTSDLSICFFLPPIYGLDNRRPYYSREMAQQNIDFKRNSTGLNNKVLLFYNSRSSGVSSAPKPKKVEQKTQPSNDKHSDIIEGLKSLGLSDTTSAQIDAALSFCFPNGSQNIDDSEKLNIISQLLHPCSQVPSGSTQQPSVASQPPSASHSINCSTDGTSLFSFI